MAETTDIDRTQAVLAAATIAFAIVVPGVLNYLLGAAGYELVGSAVWALGYGGAAVMFWYVFIRPLDLTGPD
ncbi:hypothetical protein [Haloarchaeobius sp. HRN-SO-5]|uniref:hypothetical protein n=1 Tax=Haloarchaeobius sp. HRN-SO-5 TaxID=3446118 RepID=UPI003EB708EE